MAYEAHNNFRDAGKTRKLTKSERDTLIENMKSERKLNENKRNH